METPHVPPREDGHGRRVAGAALIAIGALLFLMQFVEGLGSSLIFFGGGAFFLVGYFQRRAYGLLVPGCILIGIGIGSVGELSNVPVRNFGSVGLGIGFIGVYVLDALYRGPTHWWPLIPGLILLVSGASTSHFDFGHVFSRGWPLILVVIGVLFLTGHLGRNRVRE